MVTCPWCGETMILPGEPGDESIDDPECLWVIHYSSNSMYCPKCGARSPHVDGWTMMEKSELQEAAYTLAVNRHEE